MFCQHWSAPALDAASSGPVFPDKFTFKNQ